MIKMTCFWKDQYCVSSIRKFYDFFIFNRSMGL